MVIRLGSTVINCADLDVMTAFWSRALHLSPSSTEPGDGFRVLRTILSEHRQRRPQTAIADAGPKPTCERQKLSAEAVERPLLPTELASELRVVD